MSETEAEIERRTTERLRVERVETLAAENARRIEQNGRDVDDKIERYTHRMLEDLAERAEMRNELFEGKLLAKIDERLLKLFEANLAEGVAREVEKIEAAKQAETRGTARFWFYVVMNTLGIASAVGTGIFWIVTTLSN